MKKFKLLICLLLCSFMVASFTACNLSNGDISNVFGDTLQLAGITRNIENDRYTYIIKDFNGALTTKIEKVNVANNYVTVTCKMDKNPVGLTLSDSNYQGIFNVQVSPEEDYKNTVEFYNTNGYLTINSLEKPISGVITVEFCKQETTHKTHTSLAKILEINSINEFNLYAEGHGSKWASANFAIQGETLNGILQVLNVEYLTSTFNVNKYLDIEENDYELLVTFAKQKYGADYFFYFIEGIIYAITNGQVFESVTAYDKNNLQNLFYFETWKTANYDTRKEMISYMPSVILDKSTEEITKLLGTPDEIHEIQLETYPPQFGGYLYYYYLEEFAVTCQQVFVIEFDQSAKTTNTSIEYIERSNLDEHGIFNVTVTGDTDVLLENLKSTYQQGAFIVIRTHVIIDADIEIYVDGVKIPQSYYDPDRWEYSFTMPAKDVEIEIKIVGGI